jgi:hypothetical protein
MITFFKNLLEKKDEDLAKKLIDIQNKREELLQEQLLITQAIENKNKEGLK